ncbi:MAG: adenosine deaminase [Xanthomonadales bacterium]|nr:adenosine deaminase [Xanthomonadales bacterium]
MNSRADKVPLIDLHRHLDGSVRLETILDLAGRHGIPLPSDSIEGLRPFVHVSESEAGLMAFLARFEYLTAVMVSGEACERIARENVLDAADEGIEYVELRFSPMFMAEPHGLAPEEVVDAVIDGVRAGARETGVKARMIGILSRTYGVERCFVELEALLRRRDDFVAIDLAGDEQGVAAGLFKAHFNRVRDAGLGITVHAGEADGPHSVWSAIRDLGASRIGHGFRSIEDPELVSYLAESGVGLEICLTSNLQIEAVDRYENHPAKALLDAGVRLNLNTDNPGISGIDLRHEYERAAPAAGLTPEDLLAVRAHARDMAFDL